MIRDGQNVVLLGVYWFLAAVALLFVVAGVWQAGRMRLRRPLQARVVERQVRVEVREVSGRRGKLKSLYALADLRLERTDTRAVVRHAEEGRVTEDQLISHSFLDGWEVGKVREAGEQGGELVLDPPPAWAPLVGFGVAAGLFGVFAWMARPFAYGERFERVGLMVFLLALFPIGAAGFGIWMNMRKERVERTAVMGRGREVSWAEFVGELAGMGVTLTADVEPFVRKERVRFCEFPWEGKMVRAVSLYCQMGEGTQCEARVNAGDLRDVKWGEER